MSYEHDGIAGLDLRNVCMVPWETDETETKRSATSISIHAEGPIACGMRPKKTLNIGLVNATAVSRCCMVR